MDKIYGIDLGTTNSCLAVLDGNPRVIPIDGNGIVPSVVSIDGSQTLVGRRALNRSIAFPEQSVRSIKRLMGTDDDVNIDGKSFKPEDISALILKYLRQEAKNLEGVEVERVVITVPAYFSEAQRRATLKAGQLAGLKVERIVNEPTAAALFYDLLEVNDKEGKAKSDWRYSLVYDLGGGTFDVSILRMGEIMEVLACTGDTHLGGDDFDACLTDYLLNHIENSNKNELLKHRPTMARLNFIAEKAKIELSSRGSTLIEETKIPGPRGRDYSLSLSIARAEFEALTVQLVDKTLGFVDQALKEAGVSASDIERVLMVGGMTRMPIVSDKLGAIFGKARLPILDPDLSVAKGAAVQGALITGENVEQILVDVTSHTLSLMVKNKFEMPECIPIITRNTPIPATRSELFSTAVANQKMGILAVFQGESRHPKDNDFIGSTPFHLNSVKTHSRIEVEFSYDLNGMIHLVAEQKGQKRKIEIDLDTRNPYSNAGAVTDWFSLPPNTLQSFINESNDDRDDDDEKEDESFEEVNAYPEEIPEGQFNFVLKRANHILSSLKDGEEKAKLADLVKRYRKAMNEDSDDIDDLEEELLDLLEK
ncbi:MAG: Hsp70 family protein [Deltaproteobacteria bacterium]|jgi:molecular chaperone DnaK|nr:Hsp70 family protein [Deltaproteobacteria bacterium]